MDSVTGTALTVSFGPALSDQIRDAASQAGITEAEWLADVASNHLLGLPRFPDAARSHRQNAVLEWLDEMDRDHGAPTTEDMEWASRALGLCDRHQHS